MADAPRAAEDHPLASPADQRQALEVDADLLRETLHDRGRRAGGALEQEPAERPIEQRRRIGLQVDAADHLRGAEGGEQVALVGRIATHAELDRLADMRTWAK